MQSITGLSERTQPTSLEQLQISGMQDMVFEVLSTAVDYIDTGTAENEAAVT